MNVERALRLVAGAFVVLSVVLGMYRAPRVLLVHGVRRREPVPIGVHELVPDDGDSAKGGPAGLTSGADSGPITTS